MSVTHWDGDKAARWWWGKSGDAIRRDYLDVLAKTDADSLPSVILSLTIDFLCLDVKQLVIVGQPLEVRSEDPQLGIEEDWLLAKVSEVRDGRQFTIEWLNGLGLKMLRHLSLENAKDLADLAPLGTHAHQEPLPFNVKLYALVHNLYTMRGDRVDKSDRLMFPGVRMALVRMRHLMASHPGSDAAIREAGQWWADNRELIDKKDDKLFIDSTHPFLQQMGARALWKSFSLKTRASFWSNAKSLIYLARQHRLMNDDKSQLSDMYSIAKDIASQMRPAIGTGEIVSDSITLMTQPLMMEKITALARKYTEYGPDQFGALVQEMKDVLPPPNDKDEDCKNNDQDPDVAPHAVDVLLPEVAADLLAAVAAPTAEGDQPAPAFDMSRLENLMSTLMGME